MIRSSTPGAVQCSTVMVTPSSTPPSWTAPARAPAAVRHVKNPIELARLVMEKSPHVLLVAEGAEDFALEQGVVLVPRGYFRTEARERELEEARRAEAASAAGTPTTQAKGTVGAVALDRAGNLAAATS